MAPIISFNTRIRELYFTRNLTFRCGYENYEISSSSWRPSDSAPLDSGTQCPYPSITLNYPHAGLEIKKILRSPFGSQLEKYMVARCRFLVGLNNFNDAYHSMALSVRFDCLKISQTEVGINLEVNWLCVCDLAHLLWWKQSKIRWNVCFNFTILI